MRIGLVAPPWLPVPPPAYGGTEAVVDRLVRGLVARGHDVVLAAHHASSVPVPLVAVDPMTSTYEMGAIVPGLCHVLTAYEALEDVDLVHDHTLLGPFVADAAALDAPVVVTNHGPFDQSLRTVYRAAARRARVVAISRAQADQARDVPIAAVIHHGVDVDRFPVGDGGGGHLAFVGRMSPLKGVVSAIEIARGADRPLRIAAKCREPAEQAYFDAEVRPRLGGDVEYLGEVSEADKLELLATAVALVNPICWPEPFGLVMIEALACGTPVVARDSGASPEIVEHGVTGFLFSHDADLARAARAAPSLGRAACRRAAVERFSTERMVEDHLRLYEAVASGIPEGGVGHMLV